ncbi:hypothetical protein VF14_12890 [Nostoc linckia z18]|uniref:Uncharacterized protein n=2 Tax=Nostoc linckia TaxID=92942 RepID=A0A9Q5Z5U9_NOSLI|nr:hypothetical protein VF02_17740 [Nostoc linckia z1]PHJ69660.1 hypothetical protein VF05_13170 [Nostoc linckia z3]PHJ73616.1 hypothetical protein VF03_16335 [Nostoc linckia z2]PHJ81449.1 hypothetical protein VF06_19330 [Nostoc linckia z4]PHJ87985.1 hypothetical protein VF07_18235 [Nostoc linckia z6]PHJ95184.1 hypothetical protein VF08_32640 [Nostoc linckia z8]PHJ98291.1 hypothetical protein VF04_09880 [Nostoc linckia z7]PHK10283.1 hypothetical protein VF09_11925 [Nostoc linckia z9]PHK1461
MLNLVVVDDDEIFVRVCNRLLREVGKRVRGKGERANKNPFPFPPLAKVTFTRGLMKILPNRDNS